MPTKKKTPAQLQREIDDTLALRELEETAADYVGVDRARAMAKAGYFKEQLALSRSATPRPPNPPEKQFEVTTLGRAVLARAWTLDEAMKIADEKLDPGLALYVYQMFKSEPVAERIRWNAKDKRRIWEVR